MSKSKLFIIFALTFTLVCVIVGLYLATKRTSTEQEVSDAISLLKHDGDRSKDCEIFDRLVLLSENSNKAKLMVAEMYARGMCRPFDLGKSLEWYQKASLSKEQLGKALFQAALWEIPANDDGLDSDQIISLLNKAKELGYHPTVSEFDRLPRDYQIIFL